MYMWLAPKHMPVTEGAETNGATKTPPSAVMPVAVSKETM
jgi:hypothetical protein